MTPFPMTHAQVAGLLADPALMRVLTAIDAGGSETRVVGGAVRNALMGCPVNDIDCATTALPAEVAERAVAAGLKAVPTGIDHGTVTVVCNGRPFEITTLRRDVATDGRHAQVAFGNDFAEDARRRDFTINALYLDKAGVVHDFTGGLADITARRVRFIGDAGQRIREDYLRIMRFFRFSAGYGEGPLDAAGLSACIRERHGLSRLSRERIRSELLRLLVARRAVEVVGLLADTGIVSMLTAGVADIGRFTRAAVRSDDAMTRLAGLAVVLPEDADRLRERLRLSNGEHARLHAAGTLIEHLHGWQRPVDARAVRRLVVLHGLQPVADALAVVSGEPVPGVTEEARSQLDAYGDGHESVPVFPLTGRQVARAGVETGPRMGRVLAYARRLWIEADMPLDDASIQSLLAEAIRREV
ncbi:CCA tRNA nucleotidyltransferase [Pseudochelatococcus contaminans]|nr:CCA tRNA nucleotidyltransferase [Pseudochelatococcus contaminans]